MRRGWVAAPAAALALVGVAGPASGAPAPAASEQRYVVTFDAGTPAGAQSDQVSSATGDDGQRIGPDAVVVDATTAEAQQLAAGSDVRVVEADVPAVAAALPSDPCFLGPGCPNATSQVGLRRIHAQLAWDVVTGAAAPGGVVVGLIDTGVASWAPELDASRVQLVPESSCASVVGTVDDTPNGHGTMVAGIVGAAGNTTGIAGVVPGNVSIRSYKVLTADSRGSTADVAGAIDCAIHDGVDVINMSLTVGADETFVRNAVSRAAAAGIVIVAAAGNAGNAASPGAYPAAYPDVVAVAAVDANDRRAVFSNGGSWVDLAAPGTNVLSTINSSGAYSTNSGTSFSSPFVAGAAALVLARNPSLTVAQVRARLEGTAEPLVDTNLGRGLVDLGSAVRFTVPGSPACATAPGYVLDGWGGVHPVGGAPALAGAPFWQGWDIARDLGTAPGLAGAYVLDGWGGVHPLGGAAALTAGPYWQGWDIARAVARRPDGQGVYVLDGWGGVHLVPTVGAAPTQGAGGPYWQGWDIARDLAVDPTDSSRGYVLDGWGGVHPFGSNLAVSVSGYTPGRDLARRLVVLPGGRSGYVLDATGRLSAWAAAGTALPPPIEASVFPYGPGRGADVGGGGAVTVVSGYGIPVGTSTTPCTPPVIWPGWDIARAFGSAP